VARCLLFELKQEEEAPSNDEEEKYPKKRKNFGDDQITSIFLFSSV
jgi:hypothetical protein